MRRTFLTIIISVFAAISALFGQIPSPNDFLPQPWGTHFNSHATIASYFKTVAAASPMVQLVEYGQSNEGRPLMVAFVSTAENMAKLEDIQQQHLHGAGLINAEVAGAASHAMVWISCSVHGNEAAGTESAPRILYDLVNPQNQETKSWLKNTIVMVDPCLNPDGYARYTNWYRQAAGEAPNINARAREHQEPWPGGRTNHYYFDLNRDWAWQTQQESKARLKLYHQWVPHIHVDLHEQGYTSPYYFAPAAQPYHPYISKWQRDFQTTIGKNHAKYFDANGWLYFTKEVFDLLYPSYGDTYPTFTGSIGMTYEQGGSGRAGRAIQLPNGDTLTLMDRVMHHLTTSLSTIEIASKNVNPLIKAFDAHFESSRNEPPGNFKSFIIKGGNVRGKVNDLLDLLDRNQISYQLAVPSQLIKGYDYRSGAIQSYTTQANDVLISAYQNYGTLAQVLLEPSPEIVDSLTYDVTAWSLIHAYGLEAMATTQRLKGTDGKPGKLMTNERLPEGAYAFALQWTDRSSQQALASLLKEGLQARYAKLPFEMNRSTYDAGTIILTKADNRKNPNWIKTLQQVQQQHQVTITPLSSGFVDKGKDFGSRDYPLIEKPVVATMMGDHVRSYSFGQVWHHFDQILQYPISIYDTDEFADLPYASMNTLVLPDGRYRLDEEELLDLRSWIRAGGHLILLGSANHSFADADGFDLDDRLYQVDQPVMNSTPKRPYESLLEPYAEEQRSAIKSGNPGIVIRYQLDPTHPLAFGLGDAYFSIKTNDIHYNYLENGWNIATTNDELHQLGFVGSTLKPKLKKQGYFMVQEMGRGHITYALDNPLFRAFWYEGTRLFNNAIFLVGQ